MAKLRVTAADFEERPRAAQIEDAVLPLIGELHNARAENEQLRAKLHSAVEEGARQDCRVVDLQAANERLEAELASERAKVARVEAACDSGVFDVREWGERGTPFSNGAHQAFGRVRAALAGGEQGE